MNKNYILNCFNNNFRDNSFYILLDLVNINSTDLKILRKFFFKKRIYLKMLKNSLMKRSILLNTNVLFYVKKSILLVFLNKFVLYDVFFVLKKYIDTGKLGVKLICNGSYFGYNLNCLLYFCINKTVKKFIIILKNSILNFLNLIKKTCFNFINLIKLKYINMR